MYAQVDFTTPRAEPPLLIKGDALVIRSNGPQVALIQPDGKVHYQIVSWGGTMATGSKSLSGLKAGQQLVVNPGDDIQENVKVKPVPLQGQGAKH